MIVTILKQQFCSISVSIHQDVLCVEHHLQTVAHHVRVQSYIGPSKHPLQVNNPHVVSCIPHQVPRLLVRFIGSTIYNIIE